MLPTLLNQSPIHPTGSQPEKHPAPLLHAFQGHMKSVLAHHLHAVVTVDMGDLLHHREQLENDNIMRVFIDWGKLISGKDLGSQEEGSAVDKLLAGDFFKMWKHLSSRSFDDCLWYQRILGHKLLHFQDVHLCQAHTTRRQRSSSGICGESSGWGQHC